MLFRDYLIIKYDEECKISKQGISIKVNISDYEITSMVGVTSLKALKEEVKKWKIIKKNHKQKLSDQIYMFVLFMYDFGTWIISETKTDKHFFNKKIEWWLSNKYSNKHAIVSMMTLIMTKRQSIVFITEQRTL